MDGSKQSTAAKGGGNDGRKSNRRQRGAGAKARERQTPESAETADGDRQGTRLGSGGGAAGDKTGGVTGSGKGDGKGCCIGHGSGVGKSRGKGDGRGHRGRAPVVLSTLTMHVPHSAVGGLIGWGGETIAALRASSGCTIRLENSGIAAFAHVPHLGGAGQQQQQQQQRQQRRRRQEQEQQQDHRVMTIHGRPAACQRARRLVLETMEENSRHAASDASAQPRENVRARQLMDAAGGGDRRWGVGGSGSGSGIRALVIDRALEQMRGGQRELSLRRGGEVLENGAAEHQLQQQQQQQHNRFRRVDDAGATRLAAELRTNTTLTCLCLEENNIGDRGVAQLANALRCNSTLSRLYLYGNRCGAVGLGALVAALRTHTALTHVELFYWAQTNPRKVHYTPWMAEMNKTILAMVYENCTAPTAAAARAADAVTAHRAMLAARERRAGKLACRGGVWLALPVPHDIAVLIDSYCGPTLSPQDHGTAQPDLLAELAES